MAVFYDKRHISGDELKAKISKIINCKKFNRTLRQLYFVFQLT